MFLKSFNRAVSQEVKSDLVAVIIQQVNSCRNGNSVDMSILRNAIGIFNDVAQSGRRENMEYDYVQEMFRRDFEDQYKAAASDFYASAGRTRLAVSNDCFLEWKDSRVAFEVQLARELMLPDMDVEATLMAPHVITDAVSGFSTLLRDWKEVELERMHCLFHKVAPELLARELQKHVEEKVKVLLDDFRNASHTTTLVDAERSLVEELLELLVKYSSLIRTRFMDSPEMHEGRATAFKTILKSEFSKVEEGDKLVTGKFAEILASYCDTVMKRELRDIAADQNSEMERIDQLAQLFAHIEDKVFAELYKDKLAKRLLQTAPNEEIEKSMLEKFQRLMGKTYMYKMEIMLNDRELIMAAKVAPHDTNDEFVDPLQSGELMSTEAEEEWPSMGHADADRLIGEYRAVRSKLESTKQLKGKIDDEVASLEIQLRKMRRTQRSQDDIIANCARHKQRQNKNTGGLPRRIRILFRTGVNECNVVAETK